MVQRHACEGEWFQPAPGCSVSPHQQIPFTDQRGQEYGSQRCVSHQAGCQQNDHQQHAEQPGDAATGTGGQDMGGFELTAGRHARVPSEAARILGHQGMAGKQQTAC